ncbi:hypothetical protein CPB86DRAFT_785288 [Serendipita vermifera]|nr:hypothetical protein CPB86DRAFT_785288 [Serendipita vermifera]
MPSTRRPLQDLNSPSKVDQPPESDTKPKRSRSTTASTTRNKPRLPQVKTKRRPISTMVPKFSSNTHDRAAQASQSKPKIWKNNRNPQLVFNDADFYMKIPDYPCTDTLASTIKVSHEFPKQFNQIPTLASSGLSPKTIAVRLDPETKSDHKPQPTPTPSIVPFNLEDFVNLSDWPTEKLSLVTNGLKIGWTAAETHARTIKQGEDMKQVTAFRTKLFDPKYEGLDTDVETLRAL